MKIKDITVVIRAAGERTLDLCHFLVSKQVEEQNIFIIKEKPFSKAVLKNFEIGIQNGHKYTLSIDADTLIYKDAVQLQLNNFKKLSENYFVYKGLVFDKFFNSYRSAGMHLYRTSLLEKAINFIPKEGTSYRPESLTYKKMSKLGFHTYQSTWAVGIHDDEQYYEDIYRKFFLHAHKHKINDILSSWDENWINNSDFKMALKGLSDGLMYNKTVYVNKDFFSRHYLNAKDQFEIVEKTKYINQNTKWDQKCFFIHDKSEFFDSKLASKEKKFTFFDKVKHKIGLQFENWGKQLKKY